MDIFGEGGAAQPQQIPADFDAEDAGNNEEIEKQFAVKAVQHLETYWSLLSLRKGSELKLTQLDDAIFLHLCNALPEYTTKEGVSVIDEDKMKSPGGKKLWREFLMQYEHTVDDYNFGSLLRVDVNKGYDEDNSIFVPRMQFLAIEIVRNKLGLNDWVCSK
jgi:hypothetical protein